VRTIAVKVQVILVCVGPGEIRVVESIEHLTAELQAVALLESPVLGYREINVSSSLPRIEPLPGYRAAQQQATRRPPVKPLCLVAGVEVDRYALNQLGRGLTLPRCHKY